MVICNLLSCKKEVPAVYDLTIGEGEDKRTFRGVCRDCRRRLMWWSLPTYALRNGRVLEHQYQKGSW